MLSPMTDAKFCDVHENKEGSLIRVGQESFYTLQLTRTVKELNPKTGKKETWNQDSQKLASCHKDAMAQVIERAKGLGVEIEWSPRYQLKSINGKFTRVVHPSDLPKEDSKPAPHVEDPPAE